MPGFDYLVVGGGTAGCIVAARLAEDPAMSQSAAEEIRARREAVVCAGAIDSPRLLQLSGIGPAAVLGAAGVGVRVDLPGIGENLMDHAEGIVVWEVAEPPSRVCATGWDAGALVRLTPEAARPDITMHFPVEAWVDHVVAHGVEMPPHYMAIAPNVAKAPQPRPRLDHQRQSGRPAGHRRGLPGSAGHLGRRHLGPGPGHPPDRLPRQRDLPDGLVTIRGRRARRGPAGGRSPTAAGPAC